MSGERLLGYCLLILGGALVVLAWTGVIGNGWGWLGAGLFLLGWYLLRKNRPDNDNLVGDAIDLISDIDIDFHD
ncbi:MAG: hypothetical protein V4484_21385 [Pseudomonadota bacterium]